MAVCSFVLFLLAIVLSVLLFTTSDYPCGIFRLFLYWKHEFSRTKDLILSEINRVFEEIQLNTWKQFFDFIRILIHTKR